MDQTNTDNTSESTNFPPKYVDSTYQRLFLTKQNQLIDVIKSAAAQSGTETPEERDETTKLNGLVETCKNPLLQVKTVFPFVFFTNEVIIDIDKISIIFRNFFASEQIHSLLVKDISDVVVETSPFFATLKISDLAFTDTSINIDYLQKSEGQHAQKVIQGLMAAYRHGIDLTKVEQEGLLEKLKSLGTNGEP